MVYGTLCCDNCTDNERNGNFLADNEDSGSSHPLNGSAKIPPECSKEKVLDKVLAKILDLPAPEPKTMVVKKTPKRVHNSNPSFLLSRTEASVLENVDAGQVKSPVLPHMMFTPSSAPGIIIAPASSPRLKYFYFVLGHIFCLKYCRIYLWP